MVVLRSNLYHLIVKADPLNKYMIETTPKIASSVDYQQIIKFLSQFQPHIVGVDNGFYIKNTWKHKSTYQVMLLKGELVEISISLNKQSESETEFLTGVLNRIMINTKFLMCKLLNSCYNPFEERKTETASEIPGFKLSLYNQSQKGIFIVPQLLVVQNNTDNLNENILMNVETGKFYNKSDVVKVDKEKQILTFRDKSEVKKRSLKPVHVKPIVGYELAIALESYWKRIQMTSVELIKYWEISISQKPQDMQVAFVDPGFMSLKGNDKALNNMIFPVTHNAYNEYYKSNFDVPFEEFPSLQMYVCYEGGDSIQAQTLIDTIQGIRDRMELDIVVYKAPDWNVSSFIPRPNVLYLIICNPTQLLSKKQTRQALVASEVIYHILDIKQIDKSNKILNEVTAIQTLSIICSKFRKAPWKLKNIPFCSQPLSVISLDISSSKTQHLSVSMCFSVNSLLSKFINIIESVPEDQLEQTITQMIQKCLLRFLEFHKRFPNRIIMFSSNNKYLSETTHFELTQKISNFYNSQNKGNLQFIFVTHQPCSSLRTYKMMTNLLSPQTVIQPGLLACLVFDNKLCLQLEMNNAMSQFSIYHQSSDPDFLKKMSELIVKLSFGAVDNKFGGGLGFLSYGSKLNRFKDLDLRMWKGMLWEGHMLYL